MSLPVDERTPLLPGDGATSHAPEADEQAVSTAPVAGEAREESDEKHPHSSIIAILLLGVFVSNIDGTLIIAQTGPISSEFNDLSRASWLVSCFFLASCAAQPIIAKLSDIYGRKMMLLISYAFFTAGNFLTGAGREMWHVLLGRVIAGIGGGAGLALVSITIADLVPLRSIAAWRSYVNVAATTGRSLGGPLGGVLADTIGWRWSFYGQVPLVILAFILVALKLPATGQNASVNTEPESQLEKLRRIDVLGAFAMIGATLSFLLGLEYASKSTSRSLPIYALSLGGTLAFVAFFIFVEARIAREPIFPVHLMLNRSVITSNWVELLQMVAQVQMMFAIPLYFQITMGSSALSAGTRLVPAVIGNAMGGLLCGLVIKRTGRYKLLTIGSLIFACLGYGLVTARWHGHTNWAESLYIFPGGFGMGAVQATAFIAITAGVSRVDIAVAGSSIYQSMGIGGSIASCMSMAILQSALRPLLKDALNGVPGSDEIIKRSIQDIDYVKSLQSPLRELVVDSYVQSLTWTHGKSSPLTTMGQF